MELMNTTIFHLRKHVENKLGSLDTAVGDHGHKLDMLDQSIRSLERQVGLRFINQENFEIFFRMSSLT